MNKITELPDKWRKFKFPVNAETIGPLWQVGYIDCLGHLADQLKAALPKWTKITNDPDTWPIYGEECVVRWKDSVTSGAYFGKGAICYEHIPRYYEFAYWRPLCDLDYPPES